MNPIFKKDNAEFTISPEGGLLFVDHEKNNRGGHLGHAMVECANGEIICFYPNCNTDGTGHSGRGWMEYCRSTDGGETFSVGEPFPYSKTLYDLNIGITAASEKAVCTKNGTILLFNLISDVSQNPMWEPYLRPTYLRSTDNGYTWEKARSFPIRGRIYDVKVIGDKIYALVSGAFNENEKQNRYFLYVSEDDGLRFVEHSKLPFEVGTMVRFYGTMEQLPNEDLIVYVYNPDDEFRLEYVTASKYVDGWSDVKTAYFKKRIRNPQMIAFKDAYFMFGRSGHCGAPSESGNFICYVSTDGINWDEGRVIAKRTAAFGAYSNTLRVTYGGKERVLIQASHAYRQSLTNILLFWLDANEILGEDK